MSDVNLKLIDEFGVRNAAMSSDSPNVTCDARTGRLWSYLEMRLLRRVVLPRLDAARRADLQVLDVGAGKGRMTGELASIASRCVAIEPFPEFYESLRARFASSDRVVVERRTLNEYARDTADRFDVVYSSGVLPYLSDREVAEFVGAARALLRPGSFLVIREPTPGLVGLEDGGSGDAGAAAQRLFFRKRQQVIAAVEREGLSTVHDGRAYPVNVPAVLHHRWPNALTRALLDASTARAAYPLWGLWASLDRKRGGGMFWMYVFRT